VQLDCYSVDVSAVMPTTLMMIRIFNIISV